MAKEIKVEIMMEGKAITHFSSVTISQQFNAHNVFKLLIPHDAIEQLGGHSIQAAQKFIGKRITISFGDITTADNTFKGVVTEVGMQQSKGLWGNIVLSGYSPTFLMESGYHYASYHKKTLSDIVGKLTGELSANDMRINIKPKTTKAITYLTQYKESHFAFINRLAAEYGEWFYYNGEDLFFGKPAEQDPPIDLLYGAHIEDLSFSMRVIPTSVTHYSYNSTEDNVKQSTAPASVEGANSYMQQALKAADTLFQQPVTQPAIVRTPDKKELDDYAKQQKAIKAAGTVLLTAYGDNPKVKLGSFVTVKIIEKEIKGAETPEHGEYLVTGITHNFTSTGEYSHTFEAIPSGSEAIPVQVQKPLAETQMAIVKDNADPEKLGRIRVQMLWQQENGDMTDWIRVLTPDAGSSEAVAKNRGFVFIPEVNDQVLLGFRYNDPDRPFVLGSMFHGKIAKGGDTTNKIKSLATRSGNMLKLNDEDGSVYLTDKGGANTLMDGAGNITTNANLTSVVNVGAKKDMIGQSILTMDSNGSIVIDAKTKIKLKVGNSFIELTNSTITIQSKTVNIIGDEGTTVGKINGNPGMVVSKDVVIKGDNVDIN